MVIQARRQKRRDGHSIIRVVRIQPSDLLPTLPIPYGAFERTGKPVGVLSITPIQIHRTFKMHAVFKQ